MNASEVLKGFAMKQVYSYLDKDPEANLHNLLDMLEKYDKNGQAVTTQVEGIRAALSDPNNNWSKLVKSLWTDIDDEQRKKTGGDRCHQRHADRRCFCRRNAAREEPRPRHQHRGF